MTNSKQTSDIASKNLHGKTCEFCEFRQGRECRRFPPSAGEAFNFTRYPEVKKTKDVRLDTKETVYFISACYEYEKNKQSGLKS